MNGKVKLAATQALVGLLLAAGATNVGTAETQSAVGPVHEALRDPSPDVGSPGGIAASKPPVNQVDIPTTNMPTSSAVWLPGYWAWDATSGKFQWVGGIWRLPPPGMRWLSGYWNQQEEGWSWVPGFWLPLNQPRLQYLPDPPPPKAEPGLKPSADKFVVPGYWSYAGDEYVWKKGYQASTKAGWNWIATHYVWTPRGSIFVPGYWDYAVGRRGESLMPQGVAARRPTSTAGRAAQGGNKLAQLRQRFETSGENANGMGLVVLDLPTVAESEIATRTADDGRTATEESLPGVIGRQVPGVRRRALPGASGRTVPGVEADLPEVAAPGVDRREIKP